MKNGDRTKQERVIAVRETLLNSPKDMSPLGRRLLALSSQIESAVGFEPRSLDEIHLALAIQNGEVTSDQDLR
jgi:hypothetical protein